MIIQHPSGKAWCFADSPTGPIEGFSIQVLSAFNTNEDLRIEHSWYIHSLPMIIMPVAYSPVMARLRYSADSSWFPRYTDSLKMISLMRTIYVCYQQKDMRYFEKNEKRCIAARNAYETTIEQTQATLQEKLNMTYASFQNKTINERVALEQFCVLIEQSTLNIIHALETALMTMFDFFDERYLTPREFPSVGVLTQTERESIPLVYSHYFSVKQGVCNQRLEKALPEGEKHEPIQWFDVDAMKMGRLFRTPADQVYKGYVDRVTLWEYFRYLDCDKILTD